MTSGRGNVKVINGFNLLLVDELTDGLVNLSLIQFLNNGALVIHPLRHDPDQVERDQWGGSVRITAAERMESTTPSAKSGGVDNALPIKTERPSSTITVSLQAPSTSVATTNGI